MTPADAREYADFNNDFAAWGQAQMKAGKTVEAAAAEYKVPDWYRAGASRSAAVAPAPTCRSFTTNWGRNCRQVRMTKSCAAKSEAVVAQGVGLTCRSARL